MAGAFQFYYFTVSLIRARAEVLERERRSEWVRELIASQSKG
jgi:heme exporter protein C